MVRTVLVLIAALLLAGPGIAPAGATPALQTTTAAQPAPDELSSQQRRKRPRARAVRPAPQQQIACTRFGCQPIPRACRIIGGRTWDGSPSGFDEVVCPY